MRQKINEHTPISSTCQKTVPQKALAPASFHTNKNGTVCLPAMSESKKIIWVHSDQIDIQRDKVAKLDEAFSRFPYLTQKQSISLAQSCSLDPEQVKVWFMAQRLRYGISWDSTDINEVRREMRGRITRAKRKGTEEGSREEDEAERQTLSNAATAGQVKAGKKQKGRKRKATKGREEVLDSSQTPPSSNSKALLDSRSKPGITSRAASSETLAQFEKARMQKKKQRGVMRVEFAKCQYPSAEQYCKLSLLAGVPRSYLVQWFSDTRYFIKKTKPAWLSAEQYKRAMANVAHEQYRRKLKRKNRGEK